MAVNQERRKTARFPCEGELTLELPFGRSRKTIAWLVDFSEQGLCFHSQKAFKLGTELMARISMDSYRHLSADVGCQPRTMGLVTVKWCQDSIWQGGSVHKMGAMNLVPYLG